MPIRIVATGRSLADGAHLPTRPHLLATLATAATGNTRTRTRPKNPGTHAHASATRDGGCARARGGIYTYRCVSWCVVLCFVVEVCCIFCVKKKRQKRGVSVWLLFCWWTSERMRVRQVKRMCDRHCPHASLFVRVGGRDCFSRHHVLLFAVSSLLDLFDDRSSTPVPWCSLPRTLQQVYSRECSLVCRHPDECEVSVAHVLVFVNCIQVAYKCWRVGSPELTRHHNRER